MTPRRVSGQLRVSKMLLAQGGREWQVRKSEDCAKISHSNEPSSGHSPNGFSSRKSFSRKGSSLLLLFDVCNGNVLLVSLGSRQVDQEVASIRRCHLAAGFLIKTACFCFHGQGSAE